MSIRDIVHIFRSFLLGAVLVSPVFAGSVVRVERGEDTCRLTINGKPTFLYGGGGGGSKELLAAMGGNTFRTWGADHARKDLDEGAKYGLTVMVGFWLGHAEHGFDYTNQEALRKTRESVLRTVRAEKDHPALLCWALGNEMELGNKHTVEMWTFINDLAKEVKALDPNHPVCTVIAEVWKDKVQEIERLCPDLDFVGINSYGGCGSVGKRWRENGGKKPYVVTEFGPWGAEEGGKSSFGCPLEPTTSEKADWYAKVYRECIAADAGKHCLGSYAFTWGTKIEGTPTWFGLLLPDNSVLESAQALQECWGRVPVKNHAPKIEKLSLSTDKPAAGDAIEAAANATDPEGDALTWTWTLVEENAHYGATGLGGATPKGFDEAIVEGQGTAKVKVQLPGGGKYRLYAYCFDGKGNAAYANAPLLGSGVAPKRNLPAEDVPFGLYGDGVPAHWYASGYMGNHTKLAVDEKCADSPHSGETCLKVSYNDGGNWAGIMWQSPANDWGDKPGGFNLSKANTLVFWARGAQGGEKVKFYLGGLDKAKYPDSGHGEISLVLKKDWTRYRIPLDGEDLSCIKTGFAFTLGGSGAPFTFYLDDIEYIQQ